MQRIQKFLSRAGIASRRQSEDLVLQGRVSVNGQVVRQLGSKIDPELDRVSVDGKSVRFSRPRLFLFYKPRHMLSTMADPEKRSCLGEVCQALGLRVFPIGRLDWDAQGLILLTNDGDFANSLLHPRFEVERTYLVSLEGEVSRRSLKQLTEGVMLDGRLGRASGARLLRDKALVRSHFGEGETRFPVIELSVKEGRNHFVKNLCREIGHPVRRLCRTAFGPYYLGQLKPGDMQEIRFPEQQKSAVGKV